MTENELIDLIVKTCDFSAPLHGMNFEDKFNGIIKELGTDQVYLAWGISRGVIVPLHEPFVIKIPFTHVCIDDDCYSYEQIEEDYGEFVPENFYQEGEYFYPINDIEEGDYCDMECAIYERAKEAGVEEVFAEEHFVYCHEDINIYVQAKADSFEYYDSASLTSKMTADKMEAAKTSINKICDDPSHHERWCFNLIWLSQVLIIFGKEYVDKLFDFLNNECITDLHLGNLGYIENIPVIFDYASFNG